MAKLGEIFVNCPEQFKRYDQNSSLIYFSNHSWSIRSWGRFLANKDGYIEFYVKNASEIRCINLTESSCGVQHVQINDVDISNFYYSNFKKSGYVVDSASNAYNTLCFIHHPNTKYTKVKIYNFDNVQMNFSYVDINEDAELITKEEYEEGISVKFILKENDVYKTYNVESNTLDIIDDISTIDKNTLTNVNISYLSNALALVSDLSNVKLIHNKDIKIYGIKDNLELLSMKTDIFTNNVDNINYIIPNVLLSGSNEIKFAVSNDSGLTWKTYKDDSWENLNIIIPQNKYSSLSDEDKRKWNNAANTIYTNGIDSSVINTLDFNIINSGKLRFAVVMNNQNYDDQCAIQNIKYNVRMKDYMQQCSESEVEVTVIGNVIKAKSNIANKRLVFNINTAGISNGAAFDYDNAEHKPILNNKVLEGSMSLDDIGIASKDTVKALSDKVDALSGDAQNYKGYFATEADRDAVITDPKEGDYCVIGASTSEDVMYKNKTIKYFYTNGEWKVFNILPTGSVNIDDTSTDAADKVWSIKKVSEELEKKKTDNGTYSISIDSSQLVLDEDDASEYKGFYKVTITHQLKCFQKFNLVVNTTSGRSCNMCVFYDNIQENSFDLYSLSNTSILVEVDAY